MDLLKIKIKYSKVKKRKTKDLHAYKTRLKITQREKVHFIRVNEMKFTQVELF